MSLCDMVSGELPDAPRPDPIPITPEIKRRSYCAIRPILSPAPLQLSVGIHGAFIVHKHNETEFITRHSLVERRARYLLPAIR